MARAGLEVAFQGPVVHQPTGAANPRAGDVYRDRGNSISPGAAPSLGHHRSQAGALVGWILGKSSSPRESPGNGRSPRAPEGFGQSSRDAQNGIFLGAVMMF